MAEIEFTIERTGFETIRLDSDGGGPFGFQSHAVGLGAPPIISQFLQGAGEGGIDLGERIGMQALIVPIIVLGSGRIDTGALLRQLYMLVRPRHNQPAPRLVATYGDGSVYELPFKYQSGLELEHAEALPQVHSVSLSLVAPKPFWTAREAVTFKVMSEGDAAELQDDLAAMVLASGTTLGAVQVSNPGDEDAFLDWEISGPADGEVHVDIAGVGFTLDTVLTETETRSIDARAKTIVDAGGGNRYDEFGPVPKFPMLPPGETLVNISMEGADPGDWVVSDLVLYTNRLIEPSLTQTATKWSTWSNGHGAQTHPTTGFDGGTDGYMQIAFASAETDPNASIWFDVDAASGEVLSPQMQVVLTSTKIVQAAMWLFNADDEVVTVVFGPYTEVPASVVTRLAIPGSVIGPAPTGTVRARYAVSVIASASTGWPAAGTMRASRGAVTDSDSVLTFFDGESDASDWTGLSDRSTSEQFALELVGASSVAGQFKPRKALVY